MNGSPEKIHNGNWKKGEKRRRKLRTIQIPVTDSDYREIIKLKGDLTWPEYLLGKNKKD